MPSTMHNALGAITIEDSVIAGIASAAAMETYGIVGLAAKNAKEGIYELLRLEHMQRGVRIIPEEDQSISVELSVILENGVRIAVVAENLIEKVRYQIETLTGFKVRMVHVVVQGIRI